MDKQEKFELIYKNILDKNGAELENCKKEIEKQNKLKNKFELLIGVLAILATIAMISLMGFDLDNNTMITLMILILGITFVVIFCVCLYGNNKIGPPIRKTFRDKFKGQAIKTLIKSFNESLEYEPNNYIPQEVYEKAEFGAFETYWSEDLIYGKTENNCEFRMAEVLTGVRSNEQFNTIFEGMFAVIETPKPFNQVIHIKENNQKVKFSDMKLEIDSTEFEELFDVYSSNDITTMQILTADIMQKLVDFYKKTSIPYEITIKEDNMYIAFSCGKLFEPPSYIFSPSAKPLGQSDLKQFALDREELYKYYGILDFTLEVTNLLAKVIKDTPY